MVGRVVMIDYDFQFKHGGYIVTQLQVIFDGQCLALQHVRPTMANDPKLWVLFYMLFLYELGLNLTR